MTDTPHTPKLEPCPFCNGQPRFANKYKNNEPGTDHFGTTLCGGRITCTKCGASIAKVKHVDVAWNTRSAAPGQSAPPQENIEGLEEAIERAPIRLHAYCDNNGAVDPVSQEDWRLILEAARATLQRGRK